MTGVFGDTSVVSPTATGCEQCVLSGPSPIRCMSHYRSQKNGDPPRDATDGVLVALSLPWIVKGAETPQDAINIAVSEVGKHISGVGKPILRVDLDVQQLSCGGCRRVDDAVLVVSGTALVGLELTAVVEATPSAAVSVAKRRLGPALPGTPLTTVRRPTDTTASE